MTNTTKRPIVVIGDFMLDHYIACDVNRVDQTSSAPVGRVTEDWFTAGGAGNVAANIVSLGGSAVLLGVHGFDSDGLSGPAGVLYSTRLRPMLLATSCCRTIVKHRLIDQHGRLFARYDTEVPYPDRTDDLLSEFKGLRELNPAAVVISDYGKGTLTPRLLANVRGAFDCPLVIDPYVQHAAGYPERAVFTPNLEEAKAMWGDGVPSQIVSQATHDNNRTVLITMGGSGIMYGRDGEHEHYPAEFVPTADTTGAGDTVTAAVAVGIASGWSMSRTVPFAIGAAHYAVSQRGTTDVPLYAAFRAACREPIQKRVTLTEAQALSRSVREHSRAVVVTNGVFDLMHAGHHRLLDWAAQQGEFLIVLINSDASAACLKGHDRPVCPQQQRVEMVARHPAVDAVCVFDNLTPTSEIDELQPRYLVKGPEYEDTAVPGGDSVEASGGEVLIMPASLGVTGARTSELISRIQSGA